MTPEHNSDEGVTPSGDEILPTWAANAVADGYAATFSALVGEAPDQRLDERERADRRAVIERFNNIARTDYCRIWNQRGAKFGTALWRAAAKQRVAEVSDDLFRCSLKHGTLAGLQPIRHNGRPFGLAALADQAERAWRNAHEAALGEQEARRAA